MRKVYVVAQPSAFSTGRVLFVCADNMQQATQYIINHDNSSKHEASIFVRRAVAHNNFYVVSDHTPYGIVTSFEAKDSYGKEIVLKNADGAVEQVMMEWERPYMEACVDALQPYGDVLELGFGLGYSASQIQKYNVNSYTVVECDPAVYDKAITWAQTFNPQPCVVFDRWQNVIDSIGKYDCIFFDTFEPDVAGQQVCEQYERILDTTGKDVCRLGYYASVGSIENHKQFWVNVFAASGRFDYSMKFQSVDVDVPDNCLYASAGSLYTAVVDVSRRA